MPAENTALIVLLFVFILFVLLFCVGASRLNRRRYAQKEVSSAKVNKSMLGYAERKL